MVVRFQLQLISDSRTQDREPYEFELKQLQYQTWTCFISWIHFYYFTILVTLNIHFFNLIANFVFYSIINHGVRESIHIRFAFPRYSFVYHFCCPGDRFCDRCPKLRWRPRSFFTILFSISRPSAITQLYSADHPGLSQWLFHSTTASSRSFSTKFPKINNFCIFNLNFLLI